MTPSRILVVEDEAIVAMDIEHRLKAMGYEPAGRASAGERALALVEDLRPDLVLMDIRLQGEMDGIAAAEEIRRRFSLPVIFLTAYSEDSTLDRIKVAQPFGYILKPFDDRELKSAIEIALYKHKADEEIRRLTRLYDVLSQVNQAVVRVESQDELLTEVCRLIVERGAVDLAWIGRLDRTSSRIELLAYFGIHGEMLCETDFYVDDRPAGRGSPGEAFRRGNPFVCNRCAAGWCPYSPRKRPAQLGFQSCASFPLKFQGEVWGVLNLWAIGPEFFRDREIELLAEVAMDVSYALDRLESDLRRMQAEVGILRQNAVLSGINRIFKEALSSHTEADLGRICLAVAAEVTGSRLGFLGETNEEGRFDLVAVSDAGRAICDLSGSEEGGELPRDLKVHGIYGRVLLDGKGFFTNDPPSHPDRIGLPAGHPPLESFLGVPLIRVGRIVGVVGMANREGGYSREEQEALEALAPAMVEAFSRKRAERALARSRAEFEAIFNSISDAVIFSDLRRRIVTVNPAFSAMFGYEPREVRGRSAEFLFAEPGHYEEYCLKRDDGEQEAARTPFETFYLRKDGVKFPAESLGMPVRDSRSAVIGYLGIHRDITDRKEAEAKREKLEAQLLQTRKIEAIGRLAGGVAHDFNNMLGVIGGHAELALEQIGESDPIAQDLREIQKATRRSADLTRQLLAFARKQTVSPRVLDLNDAVSGTIDMLRRLIGENVALIWTPGSDLWSVKIDPSQINQMLANLAVNARDAIAGVGEIAIETANVVAEDENLDDSEGLVPGEYVLLEVSDDGGGMSEQVLEHIFEPFFTTKEMGKGTGLGLATVYGIVKQNGGFVDVNSKEGLGTTFRIYLPRFELQAPANAGEPSLETPPGGTETVLIVEDEEAMMKLGKAILERLGYNALSAGTPGEAVRLAEEHGEDIRLLITDVVMPEMNGRELAERLRLIKPGLKCLYMSGYTADSIARHGILDEGLLFIQKPFSVREMAEKVRQALDE